ncbi:MAG: exosortase/archaeosortase family protein [Candidatus Dormibacteraeota bacterium]|nr:exosortase/archaeosortase family protein [Candidatus Dormibacteraeota bacterium]
MSAALSVATSSAYLRRRPSWLMPAAIVGATVAAYWFTLGSLADYLRLDTPLAYLLMLPFFALLLALVTVMRYQHLPPPPRIVLLDVSIGCALLLVALLAVTVLPESWSTYYWVERPDVISLVLFVSGALILCYGTVWFWRLRTSVVFLLLMWPSLYLHALAGPLQSVSDATNRGLAVVTEYLPLGITRSAGDVLTVHPAHGSPVSVVVSSACSGANGLLGMALIGSAMALMFDGGRLRKLLWVVAGMALIFVLNVVRIISILALARAGNASFALGAYHAVIGLVLFVAALSLMRVLAPRFGLRWTPSSLSRGIPARWRAQNVAGRGAQAAIAGFVTAVAVLALLAEGSFSGYASFFDGSGEPTVSPYDVHDRLPAGWQASLFANYDWARQYFGNNSRFTRYLLQHGSGTLAWMDVVLTDDQGALDAYNLQACYLYHNDTLESVQRVSLLTGITGLVIDYREPQTNVQWASVSWTMPVLDHGTTSYERLNLTTGVNYKGGVKAPDPQPATGFGGVVLALVNVFDSDSGATTIAYRSADRALQGVAGSIATAMLASPRH